MANANKDDPEYIAARKQYVEQATYEYLNKVQQKESEEYARAQDEFY